MLCVLLVSTGNWIFTMHCG